MEFDHEHWDLYFRSKRPVLDTFVVVAIWQNLNRSVSQ